MALKSGPAAAGPLGGWWLLKAMTRGLLNAAMMVFLESYLAIAGR